MENEILSKLFLELSQVVPETTKTRRELELKGELVRTKMLLKELEDKYEEVNGKLSEALDRIYSEKGNKPMGTESTTPPQCVHNFEVLKEHGGPNGEDVVICRKCATQKLSPPPQKEDSGKDDKPLLME